jgi:hypothetical protein
MKLSNLNIWSLTMRTNSLRRRDLIGYGFIILLCFLFFQQVDLYHTSASSYAYLNGHFLDFYDYNKPIVGMNAYFPIIYAIFALWNLPLQLLGLTTDVVAQGHLALSVIEIIWAKLLLVIFFFATAILTYKSAMIVTEGKRVQAQLSSALFATAPIGIFAVFIFGQYDIIGLFFTMAGFYCYVRKEFNRFAWFFSVAISFKFFALVIFIPLLLLSEKRLVQLTKLSAIALVVTMAQMAIYWASKPFWEGIFAVPSDKINSTFKYLVAVYILICLYAYIKKPRNDNEWRKIAIFISIAAYGTMFTFVVWHPQWLIIAMPFFALATLYIEDKSKFYLIDIVGMLAFVWWVVNTWPGNVDVSMLSWGPLRIFFEYIPLANVDLMTLRLLPVFKVLFHIYLFSPLLLLAYQRSKSTSTYSSSSEGVTWFFRTRFILGVAIFVVPSLFCALAPQGVARLFNPIAYSRQGLVLDASVKPVGEIIKGGVVTQTFKAEHDKLSAVSVKLATYARANDTSVKLALLADDGTEIATQTIDGKYLPDNTFHTFRFPAIAVSKDKTYQIRISAPDGKPGNAITAWMSETDIYPEGQLTVNGITMPNDLSMKLYYER